METLTAERFFDVIGFLNLTWGNVLMDVIAMTFIYLAIRKEYEPLLLIPIGFGVLVANVPFVHVALSGMPAATDVYYACVTGETCEKLNSVYYYLYFGVMKGVYPPLIFLGIGALTDFTTLISNPKLVLLGAAAQFGIFITLGGALALGFEPAEAAAIAIIGGADGPTAIFLSSQLAPHLLAAISIAAYSYMALVPVIQPPVMKLLTTHEERLIRMPMPRKVTQREKIIFPILVFLACTLIAPGCVVLVGFFMLGNLLKESGVTTRLAKTAGTSLVDIVTILIGLLVGASASAETFLTRESLLVFGLGAGSFIVATATGLLFAKLMNVFLREKINPLIGAAGVSAVPDSARVVQHVGREADPDNHLLMHAMGPNVAGVIGSAVAAGVLWTLFAG